MDPRTGSGLDAIPVESKKSTESKFAEEYEDNFNADDINNEKFMDDHYRQSVERMFSGIAELPKNWDALTTREKRDWTYAGIRDKWKDMPMSLRSIWVGTMVIGDRTSFEETPQWLDHEKYLRGQRFARDNLAGLFFAQLLSLYTLFSFEIGLKPLIVTGKSSEPYTAFKRYLSTSRRVRSWYSTDVWSRDTLANKDVRAVRRIHAIVRKRLIDASPEEINEAAKIEEPWCPLREKIMRDVRESCPGTVSEECPYAVPGRASFAHTKGLNQGEMAATQFGFFGLAILYPESFGIHGSTDRDLDDFCHVWRSVGYLLGIEDEFNFCTGSLEEVKQRSRDFLEHWVKPNLRDATPEWEHMLRCVTEGIGYYFPASSYEHGLLHLAELLEIPMPRIRQSMSYRSWIRYLFVKRTFEWTARIPGFPALMNRRVLKSIDRGLDFTDKELAALKEKSKQTLAKGIAETVAVTSREQPIATTAHWHKTPFLILLWSYFVVKFSNTFEQLAKKLFPSDASF